MVKSDQHSSSRRPLYDVLGVAQEAETSVISRAYRKLALKYHPDRNPDENSDEMFKKVSEAYSVLSDPQQRRIYDATGRLPSGGGDGEVSEAQRSVEIEDQMQNFFSQYRQSEEEKADFIKQLHAVNGNFKKMVKERLLFDNGVDGEVERLYQLGCEVQKKMPSSENTESTLMNNWNKSTAIDERKKLIKYLKKERKEAEEALKAIHGDTSKDKAKDENSTGIGALQVMMQERQRQQWDSMLSHMEAKYTSSGGKRSRGDAQEEQKPKKEKSKKVRH